MLHCNFCAIKLALTAVCPKSLRFIINQTNISRSKVTLKKSVNLLLKNMLMLNRIVQAKQVKG